jgi:hypothetical protein
LACHTGAFDAIQNRPLFSGRLNVRGFFRAGQGDFDGDILLVIVAVAFLRKRFAHASIDLA